jgi:hypothetical protein
VILSLFRAGENLNNLEKWCTYVVRRACIVVNGVGQGHNLIKLSIMSLYCPPSDPHNKHNNIQYQFLSLCRLKQLAMPSRMTVVFVSFLLATPTVIFWILLVIEPAIVAILCPEECWCDLGGYDVICNGTPFKTVPLIHLTFVRELKLRKYNLTFWRRRFSFTDWAGGIEDLRMWPENNTVGSIQRAYKVDMAVHNL